jgi:hypothetical protein
MRLHEVKNPLLEVIKHADLHCMEEVGLQEVTHDTENLLKMVKSLVNMHQQKIFPSGRNGSIRVNALRQSHQRHPGAGLLLARP